jgi:hypothetical protein
MPKSSVARINKKDSGDELYNAVDKFAAIRAELVLASTVLSDGAFGGGNSITDDREVCAVLVLEKAVEKLAGLQYELDTINAELAQPKAIAKLNADRQAVSHG